MKLNRPITILLSVLCGLVSGASVAKKNDDTDISGYVMFGFDKFDASFLEGSEDDAVSQTLSGIRRARLSFKTDIDDNWKSKFQLGFADGETEIKDAYLEYGGWSFADLTIGVQKEGFGLEKVTSSRNLLMIERSMISEAFAPGRSLGVSLASELPSLFWQLGYYQPDAEEATSALTGRVAWIPWQQDENLLHLGFAFSEREYEGNEFRINETLEVYTADSLIEGERINADNVSLKGVELLWIQDKFTFMAEWQKAAVTSISQVNNDYEGKYLQFSYQLTDGYRKYKNGSLSSPSESGWELTGRYSELLLNQENKEAQTYGIGINYSVNKNIKWMADYIQADYLDVGNDLVSGDAISLRLQYSF
ncbi:MAG: phosphate-selective porin OprO/OprP [Psychrosphaera sp.]|jgi:phosphate-selective porin OprO/OprP